MYHRFGEDKYPTTNVTIEQFISHIEELSKDIYNVVPLKTVTTAFRNGTKLAERTVALTIDDGYLSIYEKAWPILKEDNIPFTLFISTASVNDLNSHSMTWDQIREIEKDPLVEIGHHGHTHDHMTQMSTENVLTDIATADGIYMQELGYIPNVFAYPYGEFSQNLMTALEDKNYQAVLGQYSSVASSNDNIMALPRFAFNQNYSDIDRFKLIVNSRALPSKDILPRGPLLGKNPPNVGFSVNGDVQGLNNLACFPSHMSEAAEITRLGDTRIEIRFNEAFPVGRHRINCTMPGPDNRWYWFGLPFFNLN